MSNEMIYGNDSRLAMQRGLDALADTVKITLGPKGRSVLIGQKIGSPLVTRDGVSVARAIELPDRYENLGAQMLKEIALKTNDTVGDGTSTATVLAQSIFRQGVKLVAAGANPLGLRRGIDKAVQVAIELMRDDSVSFSADVSDAAKIAKLPSLMQFLEQENLPREEIEAFLEENARLKASGNYPVASRLLLAAKSIGLEAKVADRVVIQVLGAQSKLEAVFEKLNFDQVKNLATNCANSDEEIGTVIASAFEQVGKHGLITVEESTLAEISLEVVEGLCFERGYLSPYFITAPERMEVILDEPLILLYPGKIASVKDFLPLLEQVGNNKKSLLVIADDLEGEVLSTLVINNLRGKLKVAAVKAPEYGDRRKALMDDIGVLTSGKVLRTELGITLENVKIEDLGQARRVIITKDTTTILGGAGERFDVHDRGCFLRSQIQESGSPDDRIYLRKRLGMLTGGIAVIKVGAITETEMREKKGRVEDAVHATRAAIEEGTVTGGGVAFVRCIGTLEGMNLAGDESYGVGVVRRALEEPMRQIVSNAGHEGGKIVDRVRNSNDKNFGFNARSGEFTDLAKMGIVDPMKVTRLALQNAASIAGLMILTEGVIAKS